MKFVDPRNLTKASHFLFSSRVIPPLYLMLHQCSTQERRYLLNGDHDGVELIRQHPVDRVIRAFL